jgi:hypothetical protein
MPLTYDVNEPKPGTARVALTGSLDSDTAPQLEKAMGALDAAVIAFDMTNLAFISSAGLRVMLRDREAPAVEGRADRHEQPQAGRAQGVRDRQGAARHERVRERERRWTSTSRGSSAPKSEATLRAAIASSTSRKRSFAEVDLVVDEERRRAERAALDRALRFGQQRFLDGLRLRQLEQRSAGSSDSTSAARNTPDRRASWARPTCAGTPRRRNARRLPSFLAGHGAAHDRERVDREEGVCR